MPCVGKYLRAGQSYKDLQKAATKKIAEEGQHDSDVEEHKITTAKPNKNNTTLAKMTIDEAHEVDQFAKDFKTLRSQVVLAGAPDMGVWLDKIQEYIDRNKVTEAVADLNKMLAPYVNGPQGGQIAMCKNIRHLRDELRT